MKKIKRAIADILVLTVAIAALFLMVDVVRFPECYISTWKYQLQNDIENGKPEAIEYYNRCYVEKGRILFE